MEPPLHRGTTRTTHQLLNAPQLDPQLDESAALDESTDRYSTDHSSDSARLLPERQRRSSSCVGTSWPRKALGSCCSNNLENKQPLSRSLERGARAGRLRRRDNPGALQLRRFRPRCSRSTPGSPACAGRESGAPLRTSGRPPMPDMLDRLSDYVKPAEGGGGQAGAPCRGAAPADRRTTRRSCRSARTARRPRSASRSTRRWSSAAMHRLDARRAARRGSSSGPASVAKRGSSSSSGAPDGLAEAPVHVVAGRRRC